MGKLIGKANLGGEIWLSGNVLADRGIATAAETGVYGSEGKWLIEGHRVDPDIIVDNLPHAKFNEETRSLRLRSAIAPLPPPVMLEESTPPSSESAV